MLRWMSQDEFANGEAVNPYPEGVAASLVSLKAVPESQYYWLALGLDPWLISAAVRRLRALPGEVWIPDAALQRLATCRLVVRWLVVAEVALVVLAAVGSSIALLACLVVLLVALPISVHALRQARVFAFIDYRTRLVGVEDGLSSPASARRS